jgi:quercetin dioxygenase-like cupin family protein
MLKKASISAAIFTLALTATTVLAQSDSPITRTVLQKSDFPGATYTTIVAMAEIKPGATVAHHTHPGIEVGYVMDGEGDIIVDGQPIKHLKAGDSYQIPAGVPHIAHNTNASKPEKILITFVVEKDKPLATNVP